MKLSVCPLSIWSIHLIELYHYKILCEELTTLLFTEVSETFCLPFKGFMIVKSFPDRLPSQNYYCGIQNILQMSCLIRQITYPKEFDQDIINLLCSILSTYSSHVFKIGMMSVEKKKYIKFFMYRMFLYFNFWNKDVCIHKSLTNL